MKMFKKLAVLTFCILFVLFLYQNCHAGELLERTTFEDRNIMPWMFDGSPRLDDKKMWFNLESFSRISLDYKNISLIEGHTYTLELDIFTSKYCETTVSISTENQPHTLIWNNDNENIKLEANTDLKFKKTFVAKSSSAESILSFSFNGEFLIDRMANISISRISLTDEQYIAPTPTPIYNIAVNQLGYYPESVKRATINTSSTTPMDWHIEDSASKIVASGKTEVKSFIDPDKNHPIDKSEILDDASGNFVHQIDFSTFTTPENGYRLICDNETSMRFNIRENLYSQLKIDALKYFYYMRSGISITTPYISDTKWARSDKVQNDIALKYRNYHLEQITKFNDSVPESFDATGGWYNGLGYSKTIDVGAISLWTLQNQYEYGKVNNISDVLDDKLLNIPESSNGIPDILDEARWGMEWMLKMQIPKGYETEGMVSMGINIDSLYFIAPDRSIFHPVTTTATLSFSACAAQASRLWKDIDPDFSKRCLIASENAWKAAVKNPDTLLNPGDYFSTRKNIVTDEFYWAACELYLTTKNKEYLEFIMNSTHFCSMPTNLKPEGEWYEYEHFASYDKNETAGLGSLSLALLVPEEFPQVVNNIKAAADIFIYNQKNEGYEVPLSKLHYPQMSNKYIVDSSIVMSYAYSLSKDKKYLYGTTKAIDYIMGRNAINKCYVSGYGTNPVKYPFDNFFNRRLIDDYPLAPPGFMVSGATSEDNDIEGWAPYNPYARPPQKCYDDEDYGFRYLTNRFDISLNSSLSWVIAFLESANTNLIIGDINNDKHVNMLDVVILAKSFGSSEGEALFDRKCDLSSDGVIDMKDVLIIAKNFGI